MFFVDVLFGVGVMQNRMFRVVSCVIGLQFGIGFGYDELVFDWNGGDFDVQYMGGVLGVVFCCGYNVFCVDYGLFVGWYKVVVFFVYFGDGDFLMIVSLFIVINLLFVFNDYVVLMGVFGYGYCDISGVDVIVLWVEQCIFQIFGVDQWLVFFDLCRGQEFVINVSGFSYR